MADDGQYQPEEFQMKGAAEEVMDFDETNILRIDDERNTPSLADDHERASQYDMENEEDDKLMACPDGVLDEDTIGEGLSNLGRSADGTQLVYLHLTLPGLALNDINVLAEYIHLQRVELPYNQLTDVGALGCMEHLIELDLSNNRLTTLLYFEPPKGLREVNLAYNEISQMTDLSAHLCLTTLILDYNNISEIAGLEKCNRLTHLSLGHNNITKIQGIDNLPLKYLNLSSNQLQEINNLHTLTFLREVNFSRNRIRSLEGLQSHEFLEQIDMESNEIIDLPEIQHITGLLMLRNLNLKSNPVQELPDYRLSVLYHMQRLNELDRKHVDVKEKIAALNLFNPPMEVIAARDHIMHVVYSFLQPNRVLDSTLPSAETPYPMLVLVGPQGAGKKELAMKLVEEFPDYFGYGICTTTRERRADEIPGKDYYFINVEEFEEAVKEGKFLQTYSYHGHLYGLSVESIESVARDGLACIVHLELEGVLTLKNTYYEPRYVLILPMSREAQDRRLRMHAVYNEGQIAWIMERTEMYAEYNREHPGFFDMMINSNDIVEAYKKLRKLIMDYLGISAPSPSTSEPGEMSQGPDSALEKEMTDLGNTLASNAFGSGMGARTWSKPSIPDTGSANQQQNIHHKTLSPMPPSRGGRGVIEEESIKRRQSAAKEAIAGHPLPIYQQVLGRAPKTVPQPVSAQLGLGDEPPLRSHSAPPPKEMDALPPGSPDSSDDDGHDSNLSNISEVHMDDDDDMNASMNNSAKMHGEVDPLDLYSDGSKSLSGGPPAPRGMRPDSGLRNQEESGSRSSSRLGSDKHQVLPPIQSPLPAHAHPEF